MPVTIGEFYERWQDIEEKLVYMTTSPSLALRNSASENLKTLREWKEEIDRYVENFGADNSKRLRGYRTECFGLITFESVQEFVDGYYELVHP